MVPESAEAEPGGILTDRARRRATGVLHVDGDPAGAIHLDRGLITYAWASWCRPLGSALEALAPAAAQVAAQDGKAIHELCAMLAADGADLAAAARTAVVAAVTALTMPLPGSSAARVRFARPGRHWAGGPCRIEVDEAMADARDHARRIASLGVGPASQVSLCDLKLPSAVVHRDQWAVARRISRELSVRELSGETGIALYDTLEVVGSLLSAGLCSVDPPVRSATQPAAAPRPAETAPDVLHRVLEGLRRLS